MAPPHHPRPRVRVRASASAGRAGWSADGRRSASLTKRSIAHGSARWTKDWTSRPGQGTSLQCDRCHWVREGGGGGRVWRFREERPGGWDGIYANLTCWIWFDGASAASKKFSPQSTPGANPNGANTPSEAMRSAPMTIPSVKQHCLLNGWLKAA